MRRVSIQAESLAGLLIETVTTEPDRLLIVARPRRQMEPARSAAHDRRRFIVGMIGSSGTCLRTAVPSISASRSAGSAVPSSAAQGRSSANHSPTASHLVRRDARPGSRVSSIIWVSLLEADRPRAWPAG
jgi:hypothetical protein